MKVMHLKSKRNYRVLDFVDDCTNYRNNATMTLYTPDSWRSSILAFVIRILDCQIFVRDHEEFYIKFRRIG